MSNFWNQLSTPIVGLSPMDGVTDAAMRAITKEHGNPDVIFTEFVSAEGIAAGAKKLFRELKYTAIERPVVAQLFGKNPEAFFRAARIVVELGFDGVDINMGCPSKSVTDHGSGAGLIGQRELARKIVLSVKEAVAGRIPVSVKTRIGTMVADPSWWEELASFELDAVSMHGRTFKQLYHGEADWEAIGKAARIIKSAGTKFLGNGDVATRKEGLEKVVSYGIDGVLIGRAAMGNPWAFCDEVPTKEERLQMALIHARKYEEIFPGEPFFSMRKHLAHYAKGFDGASDLRQKLVLANSADEVATILGV